MDNFIPHSILFVINCSSLGLKLIHVSKSWIIFKDYCYSEYAWASRCLQSPTIRLCIHGLLGLKLKKTWKLRFTGVNISPWDEVLMLCIQVGLHVIISRYCLYKYKTNSCHCTFSSINLCCYDFHPMGLLVLFLLAKTKKYQVNYKATCCWCGKHKCDKDKKEVCSSICCISGVGMVHDLQLYI